MEPWYPALAFVLALCCTSEARMRTWSALAISSLCGFLLPALSTPAYIAVDFIAALLVLRKPAGAAQKMVGIGFVAMIFFHVGWLWSAKLDWRSYYHFQEVIGWGQMLVLASWGAGVYVGRAVGHYWPVRHAASAPADIP